jgi:uncharacterized coiled-coil protein SlyX
MNTHHILPRTGTAHPAPVGAATERTARAGGATRSTPPASGASADTPSARSWRKRLPPAVAIALLAVVAVIGIVGTVIGFARDADAQELQRRIDTLVVGRDELAAARDGALGEIQALDAQLAELRQRAEDLTRDGATQADQLTELRGVITETEQLRDTALAQVIQLEGALTEANASAERARADLAAIRNRFPVRTGDLADADMAGSYRAQLAPAWCSTGGTCGRAPAISEMVIRRTNEGYLRLQIPGLVDAGLFRAGGALHAVADTSTTVASCDGKARTARVSVTVAPGEHTVAADGSVTVRSLSAVVTVDAPASAACSAAIAVYGGELVPR